MHYQKFLLGILMHLKWQRLGFSEFGFPLESQNHTGFYFSHRFHHVLSMPSSARLNGKAEIYHHSVPVIHMRTNIFESLIHPISKAQDNIDNYNLGTLQSQWTEQAPCTTPTNFSRTRAGEFITALA